MDEQNQVDKKLLGYIDENRDRLAEHVRQMVHIDSVEREARDGVPFGPGVKEVLDQALSISREMGLKTVNIDGYIEYALHGRGEDYVYATGHMDVVPAGEGWREPPFGDHMENGIIYGKGVLDNKGPVITCLYGLTAVKSLELTLRHPARIIFGCGEEMEFGDLRYYLSKKKPPVYGFTSDYRYPVVYDERRGAMVRIVGTKKCLGTFFDFVSKYFVDAGNTGGQLGINYYHEEYDMIRIRSYRLGLEPDGNTGHGNYTDTEDLVSFGATLNHPSGIATQDIMKPITEKAEGCGLKAKLVQSYNPVVFVRNSPMVKAMQNSYEQVTDTGRTPVTTTDGTYTKAMPEVIPFNPSFPDQKGISHNPSEWATVGDLTTNAKIYALALYHLAQLQTLGRRWTDGREEGEIFIC